MRYFDIVQSAVERLTSAGIRVSLFIDPDEEQIIAAHESGAPVIELHTGRYADAFDAASLEYELDRIREGVTEGIRHGLKVDAGHGLHYENVVPIARIDGISELNIGHSIVARAVSRAGKRRHPIQKALIVGARRPAGSGA